MTNHPLTNWIPYKITENHGDILCHWLNTYSLLFTQPFFDETILNCRIADNFRPYKQVSDLQMITEWSGEFNPVEPTAIFFHISRCGSTLISQLLATCPRHTVLSEVPIFDQILRLPLKYPAFDEKSTSTLLNAALRFYGRPKTVDVAGESPHHLFIKSDCWHLFFYKQLRRLYPDTPFAVIYRSPDAVYRSHKKKAGMHTVQGLIDPRLFGFEPGNPALETPETYLVSVLEAYLKKSLDLAENDNNCLLLNYNEGAMPMINKLAGFAGIGISRQELQKMKERSKYHSKNPGERFSEEPVDHIPGSLGNAMDTYYMLEKKRLALMAV